MINFDTNKTINLKHNLKIIKKIASFGYKEDHIKESIKNKSNNHIVALYLILSNKNN